MKTKIIHLLTFAILLFSMLIPTRAAHAFATTWYVTSTGDGPANQANCPGNGCRLRDAIAAAAPGDIIRFALPINSTITTVNGDFSISKELTIQASPANHLTIHGNDAERIFHIQSDPGNIINVVIEGLTLTHGYTLEEHGGAIFNQNANVTLDNMVITQNTVTNSGALGYFSNGGAIYNGGVMTITNSQITNNTATRVGGIFSNYGSTLSMTNVTVSGNQTSWVNGNVGGIFVASDSGASLTSTANFNQVYIINNISATSAGGLEIGNGANVTITNSSISGNAALSAGGMQVDSNANVTISNTSISNNQALNGNSGGIFVSPDASLTMTDSTISGNSATTYGGGLTGQQDSTITFERVTVSGNSASEGGGIYINNNATANLTNVTVAGNTASNRAGGMLVYGVANFNNVTLAGNSAINSTGGILAVETINIKNSIIADNTALSLADCNGKLNSQGYNLIENVDILNCIISGDTSTNIIGVDPMLDSLSDNGGSTLTLNLLPGSPAIDSADNTTCASTDQRNYLRPQDGDSDDANICDMGALEYAPYPVPYSITRANPNPTSAASVDYSVKFSEPVSNVDLADFDITTTGVVGANIANVTGSGKDYTVTVNTGTGSGTIQLELIDDDSILSSFSGDPLGGSGSVNGSALGEVYNINEIPTSATFGDVPMNHPYWLDIEILYANGLTAGCSASPLLFCPDTTMDRAQSSVFMLRGNLGVGYVPPNPPFGSTFGDNWGPGPWAQKWAQGMLQEGLTAGCSSAPLLYCPWDAMPRLQAAVFGMRLQEGNAYIPPAATGTVFADITDPNLWYAKWAEAAYANGLLPACGSSGGKPLFCPNDLVSRGLGAFMIVRAKNLSMP